MTRGRGTGQGIIGRAGKSAARTNMPVRTANMPTIPTPTVAPQTAGGIGAPTSNHGSTSPTTNHTNPTTIGTSSQTNQVGEDISCSNTNGESNSSRSHVRTLVTITFAGLQPSKACSNRIHESFKSELDYNGVNWKGVSCDIKDDYFGEFKRLWEDPKSVEKSKINAQNRRRGKEVAAGTHTGGSISIGEYRKRLAAEMGRDPTPSELHLHVHTHGHDGKSFIDERSRIVHERFEEILREKTLSESVIDQFEAYYQAAGGEKKRRVFGLRSEAKGYYDQTRCISCGRTSSSTSHKSVPATDSDLDEFVKRLIPALKNHFFPIVIEEVQKLVSSRSVVTPLATPLDDLDSLNDDCNDLDQL
ncbi:uncharacterized protein LOC107861723 [Capsicum annuum]|uniref:uncharacterized protein LOC107861723 n=1 Tax=Capsicum annuum TaxID=4072 RepID=UPI001FB13814|nr:uncharacterized protein LOC107861723 [Capsicum annuum]